MQCALDVLKSESEQRAQLGLQEWWDALFIYLFFLKRKKKEKKKELWIYPCLAIPQLLFSPFY